MVSPRSEIEMSGSEDGGLEEQVRRLWSAYAWLRDTDLRSQSGTSRLLHECDLGYLRSRLGAELRELAGVLSGEHGHSTPPRDVVLEGSQVCYWTYLTALCSGIAYDNLQPHRWLALVREALIVGQMEVSKDMVPREIGTLAARICAQEEQDLLPLLAGALQAVGAACCALDIDVRAVIHYDIAQMAAQPYMERNFGG